ncbi:flagellin lysine-N-methylase [Myxococcus sp. K15C18031901]|uniref:flagellin lysine-N-methylase n=1 Tax=Myxococcus dinghuensis TaxID=2906761 RepID=UPI0020A808C2|nr:flagellin lysine-N-methylase [Myxococcus dinghuensis]MCP3100598.1 flagellin lysine-N-methylase [Myxococcus dinghuensis]
MTAAAPRYMTRFQCLADACEDTCCAGLVVPVSQTRWRLMREVVAQGPDAARVEALVVPNPDAGSEDDVAYVAKRDDGHCAFLDERRLCSLHHRHGEAALPDACALFPRAVTRRDTRLEVAGSFGCPEVVRLCLLSEDALEVESAAPSLAVRPELARELGGGDAEDGWTRHAERVRGLALRILQHREAPFGARLFMLGQLAQRLEGLYFRGTDAFRGEPRAGAEARLDEVLLPFDVPEVLDALRASYGAVSLPGAPWAGICAAALQARLASVRAPRFLALAHAVLDSYGGAEASAEVRWSRHAARRAVLEPVWGARLEQYSRHHAVNHWLRHPFTDAASVMEYVFKLSLRAAVARWLLLGHPEAAALCERDGLLQSPDARARLDAAAVECFQLAAKHLEQSPELHGLARGLSGDGGPETPWRMLVLLTGL